MVIERDAENLADPFVADRKRLRRADKLRFRRAAHAAEIDDAQRRPLGIDEGPGVRVLARLDLDRAERAGKAGDGGLAGGVDALRRLSPQAGRRADQGQRDSGAPHRLDGAEEFVIARLRHVGSPHLGG